MEEEVAPFLVGHYHVGESVERLAVTSTNEGILMLSAAGDHDTLWLWSDNEPRPACRIPSSRTTAIEALPTSHGSFLVCDTEGSVSLLEVSSDAFTETLKCAQKKTFHNAAAIAIDVQLDSNQGLSVGEDSCLQVFSLDTFQEVVKIRTSGATSTVARFASNNLIYSSVPGGHLELWDLRCSTTKASHQLFQRPTDPQEQFTRTVWDIGVHPARPMFCCAGDSSGTVTLWDVRMTQPPAAGLATKASEHWPSEQLHLHSDHIWALSFIKQLPNLIITAGEDGKVLMIDLETNATLSSHRSHHGNRVTSSAVIENTSGITDFELNGEFLFTANAAGSISALRLNIWKD